MRLLSRIAGLALFFALAPFAAAIECDVLVTLVPRLGDRVSAVPSTYAAPLPSVSAVSRDQHFHVHLFFRDPAPKEGKSRIAVRILLHGPDGELCFDSRDSIKPLALSGVRAGRTLLHPAACRVSLGREKPEGQYLVTVQAADLNSGKTARNTAAITLADHLPDGGEFSSLKELDRFFQEYYLAPDPERILPAFRFLGTRLPELRQRPHFSPIPLMAWFYHVLKPNPQLWKPFAAEAAKLDPADRPHAAAVIAALTGGGARGPVKARAVFEPPEKLRAPRQLDVLWSEFFATGSLRPVERLCAETARLARGISPEAYEALENPTDEDKRRLADHLTGRAALRSLGENIRRHALVAAYVEALLARKKIPDMAAARTLLRLLRSGRSTPAEQ